MTKTSTVFIAGASTGIGVTYAERFTQRGNDLVLVARDRVHMEALAAALHKAQAAERHQRAAAQ